MKNYKIENNLGENLGGLGFGDDILGKNTTSMIHERKYCIDGT